MRNKDELEQVRLRYEGLLAEVRQVAANVRARVEELRKQFPEDENLSERPAKAAGSPHGAAQSRGSRGFILR
jgi:hypothetical protein